MNVNLAQCSKWKFRRVGILLKKLKKDIMLEKWKTISGCSILVSAGMKFRKKRSSVWYTGVYQTISSNVLERKFKGC
jgi:hypothetical protein